MTYATPFVMNQLNLTGEKKEKQNYGMPRALNSQRTGTTACHTNWTAG